MKKKNIKFIIFNIKKKIRILEYKYFILNETKISDYKYDFLLKKLEYLENKYPEYKLNNSPTVKNNNFFSNILNKTKHFDKMLSIKTIYTFNELNNFIKKISNKENLKKKIEYCCEYKLDGIAANLIYKKGILISISTRGNGVYGENIYHNIKYINGIPTKLNSKYLLPYIIEIRGEICISNKNFFELNNNLKFKNKKIFSNPRNAASGIARQIKNNYYKYSILDFFCYGLGKLIGKNNILNYDNQFDILNNINKLGFNFKNKYKKISNISLIVKYFNNINKNRNKFKYLIDGLVIKVNSIKIQKSIGLSSKYPNWLIAYKFTPKEAITYIKNIKFNITKRGILIPIAEINDVIISGINIKKIYLSNINKIINLNINIGDKIIIKRSGDVIPTIKEVIEKKNNSKIDIPKFCPFCNSNIENINNILRCKYNFLCKGQINNKINHFFSKNCVFAKGIGKKIIDKISKYIKISSPIDLYKININNLLLLPNIKFKRANNIINSLHLSKSTTLNRFIYSLDIDNIGKETSNKLSIIYNDFSELIKKYEIDYFNKKLNINKKEFDSLNFFFKKGENINLINNLINNYLIIKKTD